MKKILITIAAILAVIISIMWLSGAFDKKIDPDQEVPTQPASVAQENIVQVSKRHGQLSEWVSGTLVSARHTTVASRVMAKAEEVLVRAGDSVVQGQGLIQLDARDLRAKVEQVQQALQAAITKRQLALTEKDRHQRLLQENAVSRERYDQSVAAYQVASSEVQRVRLQLAEAKTALSYTLIESSVNGKIIDRLIEPGDTVVPGKALLRIYDPSVLRVEVPVRETLAIHLTVGEVLQVNIPAVNQTVEGVIDEIVPFAEAGARTLLIKLTLPYHENFLAGMFAKVEIPSGQAIYLAIPKHAIEGIGQLEFVNVVTEAGDTQRRMVTTGKQLDQNTIEVLSGLAADEKVLLP